MCADTTQGNGTNIPSGQLFLLCDYHIDIDGANRFKHHSPVLFFVWLVGFLPLTTNITLPRFVSIFENTDMTSCNFCIFKNLKYLFRLAWMGLRRMQ